MGSPASDAGSYANETASESDITSLVSASMQPNFAANVMGQERDASPTAGSNKQGKNAPLKKEAMAFGMKVRMCVYMCGCVCVCECMSTR